MMHWSADDLARLVEGHWQVPPGENFALSHVGIDTREDLIGGLFVAIAGHRFDGHDFVQQAQAAGAAAILAQRPVDGVTIPILLVDDTRHALGELARDHRRRLNARVIAITGSAGKTTTKQLIHSVLRTALIGTAAKRSFNNDIGVPLTLLGASVDDDYVVVEMGMNRPGEIAALARIAEPDVAVITMIGRAHLEGLGSLNAITREKASILRHVRTRGTVVIRDADGLDPYVPQRVTVVRVGSSLDVDIRLVGRTTTAMGQMLELGSGEMIHLPLPGRHNAENALYAVAVGRALGLRHEQIAIGLASADPPAMRMECVSVGAMRIWNDSYNANPDSMIAALDTFLEVEPDAVRRVLVLGDMLELGEASVAMHRELGARVQKLIQNGLIADVLLVGRLAAHIGDLFSSDVPHVSVSDLSDESMDALAARLCEGDAVLLKGSRGVGLERILNRLRATIEV